MTFIYAEIHITCLILDLVRFSGTEMCMHMLNVNILRKKWSIMSASESYKYAFVAQE